MPGTGWVCLPPTPGSPHPCWGARAPGSSGVAFGMTFGILSPGEQREGHAAGRGRRIRPSSPVPDRVLGERGWVSGCRHRAKPRWRRKSVTLEKAAFPLVCWGSDSEHRAGCEEVNYNPAHERGWQQGLRSPGRAGARELPGASHGCLGRHVASGRCLPRGPPAPNRADFGPKSCQPGLAFHPAPARDMPGTPRSPTAGDIGGFAVPPALLSL